MCMKRAISPFGDDCDIDVQPAKTAIPMRVGINIRTSRELADQIVEQLNNLDYVTFVLYWPSGNTKASKPQKEIPL